MFRKTLILNFLLLFTSSICFAQTLNDIQIKGNKRLSKQSIIMFGDIQVGKNYNADDLNKILNDLYETEFFEKVNLNLNKNILLISLVENPIIEEVEINGIKSANLTKALMDSMKLKSRKSYVETSFLNDVNLINNIIKSNGYYFAEVKTSAIRDDVQNTVRLIYDINLGKKAKINEIVFIGDKKVKDRKLRNLITSEESKFWKFISKKSHINTERIKLDTRLLNNYYKNNGYYNVQIENSFVEFQDNNAFKLTFNINAGEKYTFNKLSLSIPPDYDIKYFASIEAVLSKLQNKIYSLNKINKILKEIDKIALSKQYEFITASLQENIIDNNKLDILISLNESKKFYVQKINILGNQYTIEEVIRNSLIVDEGDPYNEILFNKSLNNLKAKNIFGKVTHVMKEGKDKNLKIIDIILEEKPTGEISLGAGIGTSGGTIGGGIKENNFLGKGIKLNTNLTVSENSVKGTFVYERPNFAYTDNTLFTRVKSTTKDNLVDNGYKTSDLGLALGTSFEQYENLYFNPEISASLENLETTSEASSTLKKQEGDYFDVYFNYFLNYDLRNQRYQPSDGYKTTFYQELPMVSDSYEIANPFTVAKYQKLTSEMVGKISFYGKAVNTFSGDDVRLSKRLSVPSKLLRGFESGKVGPKDGNDFVGGNYVTAINASTTLPQFLSSFQNADLSLFLDTANIWGVDYDKVLDDKNYSIKSAAGLSLDLITPIGPLNFSLSTPISKDDSDITETFRFNLGTTF